MPQMVGGGGEGGGSGLGQIIGKWDINSGFEVKRAGGYASYFTSLYAFDGPDGNYRLDTIPGANFTTPSSSPPNPDWQLENLPAGNYLVGGTSLLGTDRASNWVAPASLGQNGLPSVAVSDGVVKDFGNTFVMTPGYFHGNILLKDPYTVSNPTDYSGLEHLVFNADHVNGDGVPDYPLIGGGYGSFVGAIDDGGNRYVWGTNSSCSYFSRSIGAGCSQTAWPYLTSGANSMSAFDPTLGELRSNYGSRSGFATQPEPLNNIPIYKT